MTRTLKETETIDKHVYALNQLARDCEFQDVRANNYKDDLNEETFINGIGFSTIRQGFFEQKDLNFQTAVRKAQLLDQGDKQSDFCSAGRSLQVAAVAPELASP